MNTKHLLEIEKKSQTRTHAIWSVVKHAAIAAVR